MDQQARSRRGPVGRKLQHFLTSALMSAALLSIGCEKPLETSAHAKGDTRPKVSVAKPELGSVAEFGEYTGRTEAPDAVELRARVNGYLQRAAFREGELVEKGQL